MVVHIHIYIYINIVIYIFTVFTVDVYKRKIVLSKKKQIINKSKTIKVRTLFLVWVLLFLNGLWGHHYFGCRSLAAVSLNRFTQVFWWCLMFVFRDKSVDPETGPPIEEEHHLDVIFFEVPFQFWGCSYWRALTLLLVQQSCFGMSWYHDPLTMTRSPGSLLLWGCEVGSSIPIHDFNSDEPYRLFLEKGIHQPRVLLGIFSSNLAS